MPNFKYNDKVTLFYEEKGNPKSDQVVAFLNGVMASTTSWVLLYPIFEKMGFRVILHDFKGQLMSSKPKGPYTFKEHAAEARALFEHLGVEKVHLIGTSYGGEVAMKFASLYPEMTKTISIIDSVSELDPVLKGMVSGWKVLCDLDGVQFFHGLKPMIYGAKFLETHEKMLDERALALKDNPNDYLEGQKILYDTFAEDVYMTPDLKKITCPALVIVGQDDFLKPIKFSRIIAENIKDSELVILPDCGHVAIFEKPKELNTLLLGFILKHQ